MITTVNTHSYTELSHLTEAVMSVNEAYFGDGPIKEIQVLFSKFRQKWLGKPYNPKINYDPDLIKFNRACENLFGYYKFGMSIDPSNSYNAFMINVDWAAPKGSDKLAAFGLRVLKTGNGFCYDKSAGVVAICMMLYGLLRDDKFTDRELLGIMLHEIGHSFTKAVFMKGGLFSRQSRLSKLLGQVNEMIKDNVNKDRDASEQRINNDLSKISIIDRVKSFFSNLAANKLTNPATSSIHSFAMSAATAKGGDKNKNTKYYDYTNEKFADTFASMYGYGVDVQQASMKFDDAISDFYYPNVKTPGKLSIIIGVALMSFRDFMDYIFDVQDEHPSNVTKAKVQMEYLQREIQNVDLDPAVKAELQKQLDAQKKLIDDYLNYTSDYDAQAIMRAYYKKMFEKFGGDRRERVTDNEEIFKTIDNVFDRTARQECVFLKECMGIDMPYIPVNETVVQESAAVSGGETEFYGSPLLSMVRGN